MNLPSTGTDEEMKASALQVLDFTANWKPVGYIEWQPDSAQRTDFRKPLFAAQQFIQTNLPVNCAGTHYNLWCGRTVLKLCKSLPWWRSKLGFDACLREPANSRNCAGKLDDMRELEEYVLIDSEEKLDPCEFVVEYNGVYVRGRIILKQRTIWWKLWYYMKVAKWGFFGWASAFTISLVTPGVEKTALWWWGQLGCVVGIGTLIIGLLWFMDAKFNPKLDPYG